MKIAMLMLFASDLKKAKEFYGNILGFHLKVESDSNLIYLIDKTELVIFKCEVDSLIEDYGQRSRSVFVFEVESITDKFSELKSNGVKFLHKKPAENELCYYAAFQDCFGNVHEIAQRKNL